MSLVAKTGTKLSQIIKRNFLLHRKQFLCFTRLKTSDNDETPEERIEELFLDPKVQTILQNITGIDYNKLFSPKSTELRAPQYEFVTQEQYIKLQRSVAFEALEKLQMPPQMKVRKERIEVVMAKDPELQGYLPSKLVFIDVSESGSSRTRAIAVREMDGTLRKANWNERSRLNQMFFPEHGREMYPQEFFSSPNIENLLEGNSYLFVLDSACVQFEPDDPEYHRIVRTCYDHIKVKKKFDLLRSTRHFGPMAFYYAIKQNIEPLLIDMLERQRVSDAADTIKLLYILNPELSLQIEDKEAMEIIKEYIENNSSSYKPNLCDALEVLESQQE